MQNEQWEKLVENIQGQFKKVEVYDEDSAEGVIANALIFTAPHGTFKLVRESRPIVLEKKMHYSHRPGDTARTEYKFSDTEFSHKLRLYKEDDDGEWQEVDLGQLGL